MRVKRENRKLNGNRDRGEKGKENLIRLATLQNLNGKRMVRNIFDETEIRYMKI